MDALAPLRKLAEPGQVTALKGECLSLKRRGAQLGAECDEYFMRVAEAQGRVKADQFVIKQALAAIEQNTDERDALLDRYKVLLDLREGK